MRRAGATLAIAEELEASLEAMAQLLVRLDIPGNVAEHLVTEARQSLAAPSQRPIEAPAVPSRPVAAALGEAPVSSYQLAPGDWAVGRTLAGLDLRAATGRPSSRSGAAPRPWPRRPWTGTSPPAMSSYPCGTCRNPSRAGAAGGRGWKSVSHRRRKCVRSPT